MRLGFLLKILAVSPVCVALTYSQSTLTITTSQLPPATVGVPYSATLAATGGMLPYTWSVNSGLLPPGLMLNPVGTISGAPMTASSAPSPSTRTIIPLGLTFKVQDAAGMTATANLSISVADPVVITTASLPPATVGVPYSFCLSAQGGLLAYYQGWSVTSGVLPPGLSMSANVACGGVQGHPAAISGTPAQSGTFNIQVQVSDSDGRAASKSFALAVSGGQVSSPSMATTPAALSFAYTVGGSAAPAQGLSVHSGGPGQLNYAATAGSSGWLSVSNSSGTTPGVVNVTVNPAGLGPGSYKGSVNIASSGAANSPYSVPVSFTVAAAPMITLGSSALNFTLQMGGSSPLPQTISLGSSGGSLSFTVMTSAGWLVIAPTSGTTPATLNVSVNPAGLSSGSYNAGITVAAVGAANSPLMIPVILAVQAPAPVPSTIANAASGLTGNFAPGSLISIFGSGLGPATGIGMQVAADGSVATSLGGYRVLLDDAPAPLLMVQAGQINTIIPLSLAGHSGVRLQIEYNGVKGGAVNLPLAPTAPAFFTADGSGQGQGAILNQDMTPNSANNPADPGSVVVLYGSGGGPFQPPLKDGTIAGSDLSTLALSVSVQIGGAEAEVLYAGSAPGLIAGEMQIDVRLPQQIPSGDVPVLVKIGDSSSPSGVTVAVR